MSTPLRSDPGGTPRFPLRGDAKREPSIYSREQFGPWKCDVHVTPITGMRSGYPVFEIRVAWERGPAIDDSLGPAPPTGMSAADVYYVDRQARDLQVSSTVAVEIAVEVARRAVELLEAGAKPDLPALARAVVKRAKG